MIERREAYRAICDLCGHEVDRGRWFTYSGDTCGCYQERVGPFKRITTLAEAIDCHKFARSVVLVDSPNTCGRIVDVSSESKVSTAAKWLNSPAELYLSEPQLFCSIEWDRPHSRLERNITKHHVEEVARA